MIPHFVTVAWLAGISHYVYKNAPGGVALKRG